MSKNGKAGADTLPIQKRADEQREEPEGSTSIPGEIDKVAQKGGRVYTVEETRSYRLE
jgi:hypothetical protein